MSEKKAGLLSHEVQIGRHYWCVCTFDGEEVDCVIQVSNISGNMIEGKILDTVSLEGESLVLIFSKSAALMKFANEVSKEYEATEVLTEHLIREVSADELKALSASVETSIKNFFSAAPPIKRRLLN